MVDKPAEATQEKAKRRGKKPGPARRVAVARCPKPEHHNSWVVSRGIRTRNGKTVRNYLCKPLVVGADGKTQHQFAVVEALKVPVARWQAPPACEKHPDGRVTRNGVYGRGKHSRQRYRCVYGVDAANKAIAHTFTPDLPREHIGLGDKPCPHCEEQRGLHRGETATARRHRFSTRTVVRALEQLSLGRSYGKVSVQALQWSGFNVGARRRRPPGIPFQVHREETLVDLRPLPESAPPEPADLGAFWAAIGVPADDDSAPDGYVREDPPAVGLDEPADFKTHVDTTEPPSPPLAGSRKPRKETATRRQRRNAWRLAAGWVEAFAPVIWDPLDKAMREKAVEERARLDALLAAGKPLDRPQVLLIDDYPVWGREGQSKRRDGGFYLLIAAELEWLNAAPGRRHDYQIRIRLIRAMPKSTRVAWRLVFHELGYEPDFVISDAGTGVEAAAKNEFRLGHTTFVPSLWHTKNSIRRAFKVDYIQSRDDEIERHLKEMARGGDGFESREALGEWWDKLRDMVRAKGMDMKKFDNQRSKYEGPTAAILPALASWPEIPAATGGLESIQRAEIEPVIVNRTQFGNIERTNHLFDLVVARLNGAFEDHAAVARLIRHDVESFKGWTIAMRSYDDPQPDVGRYSSLRDATLLSSLVAARGIA